MTCLVELEISMLVVSEVVEAAYQALRNLGVVDTWSEFYPKFRVTETLASINRCPDQRRLGGY